MKKGVGFALGFVLMGVPSGTKIEHSVYANEEVGGDNTQIVVTTENTRDKARAAYSQNDFKTLGGKTTFEPREKVIICEGGLSSIDNGYGFEDLGEFGVDDSLDREKIKKQTNREWLKSCDPLVQGIINESPYWSAKLDIVVDPLNYPLAENVGVRRYARELTSILLLLVEKEDDLTALFMKSKEWEEIITGNEKVQKQHFENLKILISVLDWFLKNLKENPELLQELNGNTVSLTDSKGQTLLREDGTADFIRIATLEEIMNGKVSLDELKELRLYLKDRIK